MVTTTPLPRRRNRPPRTTRAAILWTCTAVAVVAAMGFATHTLPMTLTRQEVEIAVENGLPLWGSTHLKIQTAQNLADTYRTNFLSTPEFHKVLRTIDKKHAAEHYITPPSGCEATILLVRHCEKSNVREHCAYVGFERSVYLATLFGDDTEERWPAPSYIFALGPGARKAKRKMNFREIETVGPLAEKVGVHVDDSYTESSGNKLANHLLTLLQTGDMCGKVAVVSWKHSNIGHLAHRLGCGPLQGCPLDYKGHTFDDVWSLKFTYRELDHSVRKSLKLPKQPEWKVFGSVQTQGFDPLSFSKIMGDYPPGGTKTGARWKKAVAEIPERKKASRKWKEEKPEYLLGPDATSDYP